MEKHLSNIKDLIDDNLVVKIVAPNGSGKSTLLPKHLGEKYQVVVIVSTKNIADSLNLFQFKNVTYISSKDFLRSLNKKFPQVLILDEMDTGSIENFLIISLWKKSKENNKLILLSTLGNNMFPESPTYTIENYKKSEIRYLNNKTNLIDLIYRVHNSTAEGDFLIFTLFSEIENIIDKLKAIIPDAKYYSDKKLEKDMYIPGEKRKIIVASDVAKTSLTLKNIGVVFDTMLEKRLVRTVTGGAKMQIKYISKRDADLRAKPDSIVYRLISKKDYDMLPEFTEEILFRMPLHHVMLDIYSYNLDPYSILENKEELDFMFNLFLKYNIIDLHYKMTNDGKLLRKIPFGIRTALLCLKNTTFSSVVLAALIENFTADIFIDIKRIGLKSNEDIEENFEPYEFYERRDNEVDFEVDSEEHIRKYFEKFRGYSDAETFLNIYQDSLKDKNLKRWCQENFISHNYMKNVYSSIEKVSKILKIEKEDFETIEFLSSIKDLIEEIYIEKRMNLILDVEDNTEYMDFEGEIFSIDPQSVNQIEKERPLEIYGLITSILDDSSSLVSFSYALKSSLNINELAEKIVEENIEEDRDF